MKPAANQIAVSDFRVDMVPAGSQQRLHLVIDTLPDGSPLIFPCLVARGGQAGKTLLVTGGVHGDEYEGPLAIQEIFEELDVGAMRGTFIGIPILNSPAFIAGRREGGWDGLNLARIFPGRADGYLSQRIAHAFQTYLVGLADLYADLHSGGNLYAIKALAGYQIRPGAMGQTQREAAIAFGLDLVWGTTALPGRSLSAAGDEGVPAIYVEMPGEGRCRPEDLAVNKQGVRNLLAYLNIIDGTFPTQPPPFVIEDKGEEAGHLQLDQLSPTSGLFVPAVELWQKVSVGDCLGWVRHPDGTVLAEIKAERSGRVLLLRTFPRVFSGETLAYILALPGSAD